MKFKKFTESFDVDKVQKRIACTTEFDNGHVIFNDYFRASSADAEEMARKKSIEEPDKVFYVKYDNIMEPCSDIKWKNGQKIIENLDNNSFDGFKKGDRVMLDNGQTAVVLRDQNPDDEQLTVEIDGMNQIKYPWVYRVTPIYESQVEALTEAAFDDAHVWPIGSNTLTAYDAKIRLAELRSDLKIMLNCETIEDVQLHADEFLMYNCANIVERSVKNGMSEEDAIEKMQSHLMKTWTKWKDDVAQFRANADAAYAIFNKVKNALTQYELIESNEDACILKYRPVEGATHKDCIEFVDAVVAASGGNYDFTGRGGSWTRWDIKTDEGVMIKAGWDKDNEGDIWSVSFPRLKFESTMTQSSKELHKEIPHNITEGIYGYFTYEETGKKGRPVYTLTYGNHTVAVYDKNDFSVSLSKDWERHTSKLIEWFREYYPGFFTRPEEEGSGTYVRFVPVDEDEAKDYIKNQSIKFISEATCDSIDGAKSLDNESLETAVGGDDFDGEVSAMRDEQRDVEANSCCIIVGITNNGTRLFYNSVDNTFVTDIEDATKYSEKDIAIDDWSKISRSGFKRIFIPIYDPQQLHESAGASMVRDISTAVKSFTKDDPKKLASTVTQVIDSVSDEDIDNVLNALSDKVKHTTLPKQDLEKINTIVGDVEKTQNCRTLNDYLDLIDVKKFASEHPEAIKSMLMIALVALSIIEPTPVGEVITAIVGFLPARVIGKIYEFITMLNPITMGISAVRKLTNKKE